jgi:predicted RNA-binding Zn-ribbon protein involved in translation (DUF1610 family)
MSTQYGGMGRTAFDELLDALDMNGARGSDEPLYHSHTCSSCNTEWGHADDTPQRVSKAEFEISHSCPRCGARQVWKAQHGLSRVQCAALPHGIR